MKYGNEKTEYTLNTMISKSIIPVSSTFKVTQELVDIFYSIYDQKFSISGKKNKKTNIKYAKKLAGLSLMKLNIARAQNKEFTTAIKLKVIKPKCGLLYLISNPAFPGFYKVGITRDLDKRLNQYQTADPHRKYKVEHYIFVENIKEAEKYFLNKYKTDLAKGEWVESGPICEEILNY